MRRRVGVRHGGSTRIVSPRAAVWAISLALLTLAAGVAPAAAAPAGTTLLVSRPDGLGPVPPAFDNFSETPAALSADGRYAAFVTSADGFAAGTNPFFRNVLLRDTQTSTTTLVSRSDGAAGLAADEDATSPAIAVAPANVMPDAPAGVPHVLVAFTSSAADLVDHATGTAPAVPGQRIWLRDVTAGTTYLVSKADGAGGAPSNDVSDEASIDVGPAGPVVAFFSNATNLGNSGGIFLRTLNANDTELISCHSNDCSGTPTGANAFDPSVRVVPGVGGTLCSTANANGCVLVAFDTADASITNDAGGKSQIIVAVAPTSTTDTAAPSGVFIASRPNGSGIALGDGDSTHPSLDSDGRAVAFISKAGNLTPPDVLPANPQEAYLRRLDGSTTKLVSRADGAGGAPANSNSRFVSLGGDVSDLRTAFETDDATNFGAAIGTNVWVRDDAASTTSLLNRAAGAGGAPGDLGAGFPPTMSADGSSVLFESGASNLGDGPAGFGRLHVRRLDSGALAMVSRPDGTAAFASLTGMSQAGENAISDDGRYVAFQSTSSSLPGSPSASNPGIFVRDLLTGSTVLVSRASGAGGAMADGFSSDATISGDGRYVAFTSAAGNLAPGTPAGVVETYVRDLVAQTTTLVSRANGPTGSSATSRAADATISRDGRVVVFDTVSALDPAAADGHSHVYERDLAAQTTTLVDRDDGAAGAVSAGAQQGVPDADGGRVAWVSQAPLAGAPADGKYHVFRRDLRTGSTLLVSRADGVTGASAAGDSISPSIDGDGNVVAFQSNGQNLGATFVNSQTFVRDVAGGRTQLVSRASGAAGAISSSSEFSSLDAAGDRVAFSAYGLMTDAGLVPTPEILLRDLPSQTTTLVSRADGAAGAMADGRSDYMAMNATGDCVAFTTTSTNLGDGFGSADFASVHLRVLRGVCPIPAPVPPSPPPVIGISGKAPAAVLRALAIAPKRFHVGGRTGGTKIAFTLDKAARVTLAFDRLTTGHRVKRRCVARTKLKHTKRCTITKRVGTLIVNGRKGRTTIKFSGKLGRRALARGSYRLTATPAGGKAHTLTFAVVAAPKPKHRARTH